MSIGYNLLMFKLQSSRNVITSVNNIYPLAKWCHEVSTKNLYLVAINELDNPSLNFDLILIAESATHRK
mgnify:CR=1 FL=1